MIGFGNAFPPPTTRSLKFMMLLDESNTTNIDDIYLQIRSFELLKNKEKLPFGAKIVRKYLISCKIHNDYKEYLRYKEWFHKQLNKELLKPKRKRDGNYNFERLKDINNYLLNLKLKEDLERDLPVNNIKVKRTKI